MTDFLDAVWYIDASQARATLKGMRPDTYDIFGNIDAGQARATIKGSLPD